MKIARPGREGFLFGCDPELFIKNEAGVLVTAAGLIPGTKEEPHKVEFGAVQVDGMAAEFNIDPVDNFRDWNRNIIEVMRQLKAMLPKGYTFCIDPSVRFSQEEMDAAPETSKIMGCDPDFNAWTGDANPYPDCAVDPLLRTASGHVHIGWTEGALLSDEVHLSHCRDLMKQLDWFLGAWSLRIDKDVTRRQLYGKAGAFRPKPYGAEYRVLSNFWIASKEHRMTVWNRLQDAIHQMKRYYMPEHAPHGNEVIIDRINNGGLVEDFYYPVQTTSTQYAR